MKKFLRVGEPAFLAEKWKDWGDEWVSRRASTPPRGWIWHEVSGVAVNDLLMAFLKAQTQNHCSFCDAFPVSPPSDNTIEHFRPKAQFPLEAFHWPNLYFCCRFCQHKEGTFSELVLRPDDLAYRFEDYFYWDYTHGRLEINPSAPPEIQVRAEATRTFFRLNVEHPQLRIREMRKRMKDLDADIDDFAYRHFLDV